MAVHRHGKSHLWQVLAKATDAAEVVHADDLLAKVKGYIADAERIMREADTESDKRLALQALDRAMGGVTLLAKLSGDIHEGGDIKVLVASPQWAETQSTILRALAAFPDAKAAVLAALNPELVAIP